MSKIVPNSLNPTPASALRSAAAGLPEDIEKRAAVLAAIHHDYRSELIPLLEPIINGRIKRVVASSIEEKRDIAKRINEDMRHYGLAIRCEIKDKSDPNIVKGVYPGYFIADPSYGGDKIGRFRYEYPDNSGKLKRVVLPESEPIALMVAVNHRSANLAPKEPSSFVDIVTKSSERER